MILWQNIIAFGLIAAAAIYVAVYLWRASRGKKSLGCAGCTGCPAAAEQQPLVHIESAAERTATDPK